MSFAEIGCMQYHQGLVVKCPNCRVRCTFEFFGRQVQDMQCPWCMTLFKIVIKGVVWSWDRDGVVKGIRYGYV